MGSTSRSITHRWVALGDFLYICIVIIHFSFCLFCFMDVSFFMSYFSLWQMSSESEVSLGSWMALADTLEGLLLQLG
jgi:hypothetical protein